MKMVSGTGVIHPSHEGVERVVEAARDMTPVSGLTHNFYRYPARFSPSFVRAAIHAFSDPGNWVVDPFAGGGTTLVEALAAGRNALGIDISSLAVFVCRAKTLMLDEPDVGSLRHWARGLRRIINMHAPGHHFPAYADAGYYRHISGREYWRLRKAIEQALSSIMSLQSDRARTLARCVVLKTAQWALDARKTLPNVPRFREELAAQAEAMVVSALELRSRVEQTPHGHRPEVICLNRPTAGLELDPRVAHAMPPKLIITSPPYPGIHVLYHRWQVGGGKEAPAPFWIANKLDGAGSSYYTMGDRRFPNLQTYFQSLETSFRSIAKLCGPETTVIQMVAFSDPTWQMPRYLKVMEDVGLTEVFLPSMESDRDGRLWRSIPNRRWYADQRGETSGSQEVVLVHRLSAGAAKQPPRRSRTAVRPPL